jgi:hypothetical protein
MTSRFRDGRIATKTGFLAVGTGVVLFYVAMPFGGVAVCGPTTTIGGILDVIALLAILGGVGLLLFTGCRAIFRAFRKAPIADRA